MNEYLNNSIKRIFARFGLQVVRLSSRAKLSIDVKDSDLQIWKTVEENTMAPSIRIFTLIDAVRYVIDNDIQGDFVECGVWRAGAVQSMALTLNQLGVSDRRIWLYDTFEGMTEPTEKDTESSSGKSFKKILEETPKIPNDKTNYWCHGTLDQVLNNLKLTNYPLGKFQIVQGDVAQTLNENRPKEIAILRLDTDLFESTRVELEVLYPLLTIGGVIIIDDYGHFEGARKAVDTYLSTLRVKPLLTPIDYTCRVGIKI